MEDAVETITPKAAGTNVGDSKLPGLRAAIAMGILMCGARRAAIKSCVVCLFENLSVFETSVQNFSAGCGLGA